MATRSVVTAVASDSTGEVTLLSQGFDPGDHGVCVAQPAIVAKDLEGRVVALRRDRGAGIRSAGDEIAAVGAVTNDHVHALVGQDAGHDQMADAEVLQHIVDFGRVEDARRGLGQHDLVADRRQRSRGQAIRVAWRDMDRGQLVVERAVAAVLGQELTLRSRRESAAMRLWPHSPDLGQKGKGQPIGGCCGLPESFPALIIRKRAFLDNARQCLKRISKR